MSARERFSRGYVLEEIAARKAYAIAAYELAAKRKFDPSNGTAQIPDGNTDAALAYGMLFQCARLTEEFR